MRILVTGSQGFIGRHVVNQAERLGHEVWLVDRRRPNAGVDVRALGAEHVQGVDAIVHCAAHADVRENWYAGVRSTVFGDNVDATRHLLDVAMEAGHTGPFVFFSTGAVYAGLRGAVDEDTAVRATSPYAASKLAGEAYVQAYAEKCGWPWFVIRPAACFGPGYHHGHVADFVRMAKEQELIEALDDGSIARPAVHVLDVAEVAVAFATQRAESGIYNMATGLWSWPATVDLMSKAAGRQIAYSTPKGKKQGWVGDGRGATFGCARARAMTGFRPRPISQGVEEALSSLGWP